MAANRTPTPGSIVGGCRIEETLGSGGFGAVYRGVHVRTRMAVAVKLLAPDAFASNAEFRERFRREAEALRSLQHPNVVRLIDAGEEDGRFFQVMELVAGGDLKLLIDRRAPLPVEEAILIVRQAALGLGAAHRVGIVHRDVKPHNLFLADDGTVKLGDFGLARVDGKEGLTASGVVLGTLDYVAPECLDGKRAGPQSDLYALGVTFYQLLTDAKPFEADASPALLKKILFDKPKLLSERRPDLDREVVHLAETLLAREPARRHADAAALVADLDRLLARGAKRGERRAGPRRRLPWLAIAGAAAAVAGSASALALFGLGGGRAGSAGRERPVTAPETPGARATETGAAEDARDGERRAPEPPDPPDGEDGPTRAPEPPPRNDPPSPPTWWVPAREQIEHARASGQPLVREVAPVRIRMVLVPPGTFRMGSPESEPLRFDDEVPHEVTLTRGFYLSATEITNAQFRRFRPPHRSGTDGTFNDSMSFDADDQPVVRVTRADAQDFCVWLGTLVRDPGRFFLPTEAEWERAYRGGTSTAYFWGDDPAEARHYGNALDEATVPLLPDLGGEPGNAPFPGDDGHRGTAPVGTYRPNPFGLYDMAGNVFEWVSDDYGLNPPLPATDPTEPMLRGDGALMRGGSWRYGPFEARAARRHHARTAEWSTTRVGFRIAARAPAMARR